MRLKTLRKARPAFENEGAVINGSRMDLSNGEFKPTKHRSNNTFALPTSLHLSPTDQNHETQTLHSQQISTRRKLIIPTISQATNASSYQALEAAYLERGIRIQLSPTAAAVITQQQIPTKETLTGRKFVNSLQRHRAFVNRNPSRSSSVLHYSTTIQDTNEDSRPFSALHHISTNDFEQNQTHNVSYVQAVESQHILQSSEQLNNYYCSSSIVASENSNPITLPEQLAIVANGVKSTSTLLDNDPDLAYMSSLLQTTNGDSFRETIRRRAGLRATFAVHRHPQLTHTTTTKTATNLKQQDKSPDIHSSTNNHRNSSLRSSTIAIVPTPSPKKLEKDILKHASRIRASQLKDYFTRHQTSFKSHTSEQSSSVSNSPTRTNHDHHNNINTKRNKLAKASISMSLEPLELLLASSPRPLPPRSTSLLSRDLPVIYHENYQTNIDPQKKRTKSPKISFVENNTKTHGGGGGGVSTSFFLNEQSHSFLSNDESLPLMKTSSLDMITSEKARQSNSFDSGCYDRSSSSADTQSITSLSIHQVPSSQPSARLTTSPSTRRSNATKKVSFNDQSTTVIVTSATYV